jgi:hypothetical protein
MDERRLAEILQAARSLRIDMVAKYCYGCLNDCPSQKESSLNHPCLWDNGEEYKTEAMALLYGRGQITEDEYTEALIYL